MLIAFPFESFICLSAEIPRLIPRNAIHFSPTTSYEQWVGLRGMLPKEGPSFWTWQPRTLNVEDGRKESLWMGALGKQGGQPDETVCTCYCRLGPQTASHSQSMLPRSLCSPLSEKQCCDIASHPPQMHRALYFKILPHIVLCRQCSWPPFIKISPGPYYYISVPSPTAWE